MRRSRSKNDGLASTVPSSKRSIGFNPFRRASRSSSKDDTKPEGSAEVQLGAPLQASEPPPKAADHPPKASDPPPAASQEKAPPKEAEPALPTTADPTPPAATGSQIQRQESSKLNLHLAELRSQLEPHEEIVTVEVTRGDQGLEVGLGDGLFVTELKPNGPGERAGMMVDDQIVMVGDVVRGMGRVGMRWDAASQHEAGW